MLIFLFVLLSILAEDIPVCTDLPLEYFDCEDLIISQSTYEVECAPNGKVNQTCTVRDDVLCEGDRNKINKVSCRYTNGKSFTVSLFLTVFLGFLGLDRMYLGYISLGFLKLFTLGFFGLGWMYDIILISSGHLKPVDGSDYVSGYLFTFERYKLGRDSKDPFLP